MKKYFEELTDSRQQGKIKYNLCEVVVMAIVAVTAGAEHWNEIALYCKSKVDMFRTIYHLELINGAPSDDTFQRIFAIIRPNEFERCFINWVKSVITVPDKEIVSIDGKTLRGTQDSDDNLNVIHMISAWASESQLVLGQIRVNEKSNEIPAVPELLDCIDVKNCVITSDAMRYALKVIKNLCMKMLNSILKQQSKNLSFTHSIKQKRWEKITAESRKGNTS